MAQFVQGFLASITLDTNDVTFVSADVTIDEVRNALDKSVMDSSGDSQMLPGKKSYSLVINGHVQQSGLNLLEASWAKDVSVAFLLTITEGLGTDGAYAGFVALNAFTKETAADGNWAFSIGGEGDGALVFTPSVP